MPDVLYTRTVSATGDSALMGTAIVIATNAPITAYVPTAFIFFGTKAYHSHREINKAVRFFDEMKNEQTFLFAWTKRLFINASEKEPSVCFPRPPAYRQRLPQSGN